MQESDSDSDNAEDNAGGALDLQSLLDTASKLKSAQLNKIRKEYDASPGFIRATQVYAERNNYYQDLQTHDEKVQKCKEFKLSGNRIYRETLIASQSHQGNNVSHTNIEAQAQAQARAHQGYMLTLNEYSKAISVFRYFLKCDIKGECLVLKEDKALKSKTIKTQTDTDTGTDTEINEKNTRNECTQLIIDCLLNCATVCLKLKKHSDVIWCCTTVLAHYDENSSKAYYKMCESHEILDTCLDFEYAMKYIKSAKNLEPNNVQIHEKYQSIRKILKIQHRKDKKRFKTIFKNTNIYADKKDYDPNETKNKNSNNICYKVMQAVCVIL